MIDYLYSIDVDVPKDAIRDKIINGKIQTIKDILYYINDILIKFGNQPLDKLTYKERKQLIKQFENFEFVLKN